MSEQPDFTRWECPDCEFDEITVKAEAGVRLYCPLCAGDSGHDVLMKSRPALSTDKPEGQDARMQRPPQEPLN